MQAQKLHHHHSPHCGHEHHSDKGHHHHGAHCDHEHAHHSGWKGMLGMCWGLALMIPAAFFDATLPSILYDWLKHVITISPYTITCFVVAATALVTFYLGKSVYIFASKKLLKGKITIELLYAFSTFIITVLAIVALFVPTLPALSEAAPFILGFWHIGKAIEHSLHGQLEAQTPLSDIAPETVIRLRDGKQEFVPIENLEPDDVIVVPAGKIIPVDGVLLEDATLATDHINGEMEDTLYKAGDEIDAGMQVKVCDTKIKVTKCFKDSLLAHVAKEWEQIKSEKQSKSEEKNTVTDEVLKKYFISTLLFLATGVGIAVGFLSGMESALGSAITVMVSACPCALSLIKPLTIKVGLWKADKQGIRFKDGKTLKAAKDVDTIVFDMTGTLTKQVEATRHRLLVDDLSDAVFFTYIRAMEANTKQPIGRAIGRYAESELKEAKCDTVETMPVDHGISATMDGKMVRIGNRMMLQQANITIPEDKDAELALIEKTGTVSYLVRDNILLGWIFTTASLKPEAAETIAMLHRQGKEVHLCTGASRATAEHCARQLGIPEDHIAADCVLLPKPGSNQHTKLAYIKSLQQAGRTVATIGDATNDLLAIAQSDVGMAVESVVSSEHTKKAAGALIKTNASLMSIPAAFDTAKQTQKNSDRTLLINLIYNSMVILITAGAPIAAKFVPVITRYLLRPWMGVLLTILETMIVFANMYYFYRKHPAIPTNNPSNAHGMLPAATSTYASTKTTFADSDREQTQQKAGSVANNKSFDKLRLQLLGNPQARSSATVGHHFDENLVH